MDRILVLSESEAVRTSLATILERENFHPAVADNLDTALHSIYTLQPDILAIDIPLAGLSSVELCMHLRACHIDQPLILLGDRSAEMDKVLALEAGADYYIVKPFGPREFVARVRALLRRRRFSLNRVIRFGNVEVDRQRRTVISQGEEIEMNPCEYKLLLFFLANVGLALTRRTLLQSVWGYSDDTNSRTLDVHVSKLRGKCETDPAAPRHFVTIHGVGYRFVI